MLGYYIWLFSNIRWLEIHPINSVQDHSPKTKWNIHSILTCTRSPSETHTNVRHLEQLFKSSFLVNFSYTKDLLFIILLLSFLPINRTSLQVFSSFNVLSFVYIDDFYKSGQAKICVSEFVMNKITHQISDDFFSFSSKILQVCKHFFFALKKYIFKMSVGSFLLDWEKFVAMLKYLILINLI